MSPETRTNSKMMAPIWRTRFLLRNVRLLALMILILPQMSFVKELTDLGIELHGKTAGSIKTKCPSCSQTRKKKSDPCLSVDIDNGRYNCHNPGCEFKGYARRPKEQKVYVRPQWTNVTSLSDKLVQYFKGRGISQQTLLSEKISEGKHYMVARQGEMNTVQFPYIRGGEVINVKYRSGMKDFQMVKDAELIFYGLDDIKGAKDIIIVEGEIDRLSYVEAGIRNVVSVPNGASKGAQRMEYLDNCWEDFEKAEKILLATDDDEAGRALRDELIRRLGDDRCWLINLGGLKDANDYLVKHGAIKLAETVANAKPVPIEGIWMASQLYEEVLDFYQNGLPTGDVIGQAEVDEKISFMRGQMTTITGIPNHGKSDFLDHIIERLAVIHDWRLGIFSPENYPISLHIGKLQEKLTGKQLHERIKGEPVMTREEFDSSMNFIDDHFYFIRPKDENYTLENILDKARKLIIKYGIHGLIIDPWNTIEHQIPEWQSETTYISNQLSKLTSFKQRYGVHIFLVAHPTKMKKDKSQKKYLVPTLYDIMGSAHFFNKTDNGICVYRDFDPENPMNIIYIQKIKFKHMGRVGQIDMQYDMVSGRYRQYNYPKDASNHLQQKPAIETKYEQTAMMLSDTNAKGFGLPYKPDNDDLPF